MTDTVDTLTIQSDGTYHIIRITNESDGTGESGVIKVNKSSLSDTRGNEPIAVDIEKIFGHVSGFNYITLDWDHATDDEIGVFKGNIYEDYCRDTGLLRDPTINDSTGDILLSTDGAVDGASYNLTLVCRLRQSK